MKVFISWSGDLSRKLGEAVRNWLPSALQYVKPYFTPDDIDKGAKWASEISKELSTSSVCIIILTRSNLTSSWIMLAGAISSTLENARVCPIIFDLEPTDLQGPLAQFQVTRFQKDDIRKLFFSINSLAGEQRLDDTVAGTVFEKWWPDLETALKRIVDGHVAVPPKAKEIRSDRDLIEEILLLLRSSEKEKTTSPKHSPYENVLTAQLMAVLRRAVEDKGQLTFDFLQSQLRDVEYFFHTSESPLRTLVLGELVELIERTRQRPKPEQRLKPETPPVHRQPPDDDDIPF